MSLNHLMMQASKLLRFCCGEISVSALEHPERARTRASEAIDRAFIKMLTNLAFGSYGKYLPQVNLHTFKKSIFICHQI